MTQRIFENAIIALLALAGICYMAAGVLGAAAHIMALVG